MFVGFARTPAGRDVLDRVGDERERIGLAVAVHEAFAVKLPEADLPAPFVEAEERAVDADRLTIEPRVEGLVRRDGIVAARRELQADFDVVGNVGRDAEAGANAMAIALGLLLFVGVFLHKLPEGVAVASVMLASGQSARRAMQSAGLLGLATVAGVLVTDLAEPLARYGLAVAGGVTLYVAASNLVPEFQGKRRLSLPLAFFAGAAAFFLALHLLAGLGA